MQGGGLLASNVWLVGVGVARAPGSVEKLDLSLPHRINPPLITHGRGDSIREVCPKRGHRLCWWVGTGPGRLEKDKGAAGKPATDESVGRSSGLQNHQGAEGVLHKSGGGTELRLRNGLAGSGGWQLPTLQLRGGQPAASRGEARFQLEARGWRPEAAQAGFSHARESGPCAERRSRALCRTWDSPGSQSRQRCFWASQSQQGSPSSQGRHS